MALVNGSDYDHIDLHSVAGVDVTRHMLKDAQARQDVSDLKSAFRRFVESDDIALNTLFREIYINNDALTYGNVKIGNIMLNAQVDGVYRTRIMILDANNGRVGSFSVDTDNPSVPVSDVYQIDGVGQFYLDWEGFARIVGDTYSRTVNAFIAKKAWAETNTNIVFNANVKSRENEQALFNGRVEQNFADQALINERIEQDIEKQALDAATFFQEYDATMASIIKNFRMASNTYKYLSISDIRKNYSNSTGFTVFYYDNDSYAVGVRHTLLIARGLSADESVHYHSDLEDGGYIDLDFDVSDQADGYRNTNSDTYNRIKPSVIELLAPNFVDRYGLSPAQFMGASGKTPIFTWIDDDTVLAGIERVKSICDVLGIKATFACVTRKLSDTTLTETLLEYQDEGFHITTHSHTHTKGTQENPFWYPEEHTDVALSEADLIKSLVTLKEKGFLDSDYFVMPGGNRNADLLKMVLKWCPCVIEAKGGANHRFGTGRSNISRIFIRPESEGGETLQTYKAMIDAAVTAGDWLIFGTHSGIPAQWDETLINNVISYALTKNADFMTFNQAWKIRKYNYDLFDMFAL